MQRIEEQTDRCSLKSLFTRATFMANSDSERTLRDWFAGQALVGMIPTPRAPGVLPMSVEQMAVVAYTYADAMLLARKSK